MKTRAARIVSASTFGVGVLLLAMMVTVEGEPGLLPLLLVLAGSTGYAVAAVRERRRRRRRE